MIFVRAIRATSLASLVFAGATLAADELAQKLQQFSQSCEVLVDQIPPVIKKVATDQEAKGSEKNLLDYKKASVAPFKHELLYSDYQITGRGKPKHVIIKMGDMLSQPADALVDAANNGLYPGTGVSGAVKVAYCRYRRATDDPKYPLGQPNQNDWIRLCVAPQGNKVEKVPDGGACLNLGVRCLPNSNDVSKSMILLHAVGPTDEKKLNLVGEACTNTLTAADKFLDLLKTNEKNKPHDSFLPIKNQRPIASIALPLLSAGVFLKSMKDQNKALATIIKETVNATVEFLTKKAENISTVYIVVSTSRDRYKATCTEMDKHLTK